MPSDPSSSQTPEAIRLFDVEEAILGRDRMYPIAYCLSEFRELIEALVQKGPRSPEAKEEWQDVLLVWQCAFQARFAYLLWVPWNPRIFGCRQSYDKWRRRVEVWRWLFEQHGVRFRHEFLRTGNNFSKPEKIVAAFAAAGGHLKPTMAVYLSQRCLEKLRSLP